MSRDRNGGATHLETLRREGCVVLRSVVPADLVEELRARMEEEFARLDAIDPKGLRFYVPILESPSHASFLLPLDGPFLDERLLLARVPLEITLAYLGRDAYLYAYEVNVAFAEGTTQQRVHADEPFTGGAPTGVAWNLALSRCDESNGMTRVWPGTHLHHVEYGVEPGPDFDGVQPALEPGDMVVRDLALAHQGALNETARNRYLVSLNFKAAASEGIPEYFGDVPRRTWEALDDARRRLLRRHSVVDRDVVHARVYPDLSNAP